MVMSYHGLAHKNVPNLKTNKLRFTGFYCLAVFENGSKKENFWTSMTAKYKIVWPAVRKRTSKKQK